MKRPLLIGSLFTLVLACGAGWLLGQGRGDDTSSLKGKQAPAFRLDALKGKPVALSDLKGKVVVVDFWATWCPPCRESLPHLDALSKDKEYAKKGLKVYAVNLRESAEKVRAYVEKQNLSFNVLLDKDGSTAQSYLVRGIPTTVVIDREGNIAEVMIGFGGSDAPLKKAVEKALE